jgi:hypothetical protein
VPPGRLRAVICLSTSCADRPTTTRRRRHLVVGGSTTVTQGGEPSGRSGRLAALHALEQRVLRRRGRHDLEPLQFSTDTGAITVCLVEHLQTYLDSTPVS